MINETVYDELKYIQDASDMNWLSALGDGRGLETCPLITNTFMR